MAKYRIVGVEHVAGTSKRTGRPYDMDMLHVVTEEPSRKKDFVGCEADKIPISRDSGILTCQPQPGDIYDIGFNRAGYVDYAERVN